MSELKSFIVLYDGKFIRAYEESEADKVIAELKETLNNSRNARKYWRKEYLIEYKECIHQKFKRCLAMAEACMHKRWRPDEGFDYARSTRHMKKWLELAEKFKDGV